MHNKHGLKRHIPADVAREVRARCGFGCARCGATIYEYEHFLPDFVEAEHHDPAQIILLCPSCHRKVTKGMIPKEQVAEFSTNPKALEQGFSHESWPTFRGYPTIKMGKNGALLHNVRIPIQVQGRPVFFFEPPEADSNVARINLEITNQNGDEVLTVADNEWKVHAGDWDFEWVGSRYIFKDSSNSASFRILFNPPDFLIIENMQAYIGGKYLQIDDAGLTFDGHKMRDHTVSGAFVLFDF